MGALKKITVAIMLIILSTNSSYAAVITQSHNYEFCSTYINVYDLIKNMDQIKTVTKDKISAYIYKKILNKKYNDQCFCLTLLPIADCDTDKEKKSIHITEPLFTKLFNDLSLPDITSSESHFGKHSDLKLDAEKHIYKNINIKTLALGLFRREHGVYITNITTIQKDDGELKITEHTPMHIQDDRDTANFLHDFTNNIDLIGDAKTNHVSKAEPSKTIIFHIYALDPTSYKNKNIEGNRYNHGDHIYLLIDHTPPHFPSNIDHIDANNCDSNSYSDTNSCMVRTLSLPPSLLLFSSALLGIVGIARRHKKS